MSQYFPKLFRCFGGNINVKVVLPNYATKTDLKNVTYVDQLAPVRVGFSKLSDVVRDDVV